MESSRDLQDKSMLPPHWIEVKSSVAEPGRDYYFNTKNKKSVWTVREALLSKNNITLRKSSSKQQFAPQPPTEPHELDGSSANEKAILNWQRNIKESQNAPKPSAEPFISEASTSTEKQNVGWPMNITEQKSVHNEPPTRSAVTKDTQTNTSQHTNLWQPYTAIPPPFYPYNPAMPFGHDPNMPNWSHPNVMPPFMPMPPVFPIQRQIYNEKATVTFAKPAESASQFEHMKFAPTIPGFKSTDPPSTLFNKDSETRTIEMGNLTEKIPVIKPGDLRYKLMARKRAKSVSGDSSNLDCNEAASAVRSRRNSLSGVDKVSDDVIDQSKSDTDSSKQNEEDDDNFPLKGESFGYWLLREAKSDTVKDMVYICVDSNIFINQLNLIKEILTRDKEHVCRILVTFRVLNELEKLKKSRAEPLNVKRDAHTRKRVTAALNFLCEEAVKSPSYIITEKLPMNESERNMQRYNNDDDIIYRIMQYQNQKYHIILLTDDRAMTLKASLLNIRSYNVPQLKALFKKVEQQIEKRDALLKIKVRVINTLAESQEVPMETNTSPPPTLIQPIPQFNPHIPPPTYVYPYKHPQMFPRPAQVPSAFQPDQGFGNMTAALENIRSSEKEKTDNRSLRSMSSTNTTKSNDSFGRAIFKDIRPIPTLTTQRSSRKQQAQTSPHKQVQGQRKKITLKRPAWNKPVTPSTSTTQTPQVSSNAWNTYIAKNTIYPQQPMSSPVTETHNRFSSKTRNIQENPISNPDTVDQPNNPFSLKTKNVQKFQDKPISNPDTVDQPHNHFSLKTKNVQKFQDKPTSNPDTVDQPHNHFSLKTKNVQNFQERTILNPNAADHPHNTFSTQKKREKSHCNPKMFDQMVLGTESFSTHYPSITTASSPSKSFTTTIDSSVPIVPKFMSVSNVPAFPIQTKAPLGAQKVRTEENDHLNISLTNDLKKRLENQMDMWIVMYVQIMEDMVTTVLLSERRFYMIPPPWSLHEALSTLAERFQCDNKAVATAANDLAGLIDKFSIQHSHKTTRYTKLHLKTPEMFLKLYRDARALLNMVKVVQNMPVIETTEKNLETLLDQLRTGDMEKEHEELLSELSSDSKIVDDDDYRTRDVTQTRDVDVYARVVNYLQKHFEPWKTVDQANTSKTKSREMVKEFKSNEPVTADKIEKLASTCDSGDNKTIELGNEATEQKVKKTIEQKETKTSGLTEMLKFKLIPEFESKLQNTNYYDFDSEIDENIDYDDENYEDMEEEMYEERYDEMHEEIDNVEEEMEDGPEKIPEDMTENDDKADEKMAERIVSEFIEKSVVDGKTEKMAVNETQNDNSTVDLEKDLSISENTNEINTLPANEMVVDNVEAIRMDKTADDTSVNSKEEKYCRVGAAIQLSILNYKVVSVQLAGEMDKPIVYEGGDATGLPPVPQIFPVAECFIQCLEKIQKHRRCDATLLVDSLRALAPSVSDGLPAKSKQIVEDAVLVRDVAKDPFVAALRNLKKTHEAMKKYYETTVVTSEIKSRKKQKI